MALSDLEISRIGRGMKVDAIFSGTSGKIQYNESTERINQTLAILFETYNGEVAMLPIIGSSVYEMLFEPADDILQAKLELFVRDSIDKLEPRINVQDIVIDVVENHVYVTVNYILTGTNIAGVFNYDITRQSEGDIL